MELLKLLQNVDVLAINGPVDLDIGDILYDSRKIKSGDMFICIDGFNVDGHNFISNAIENGAIAVLIEKSVKYEKNITYIKVEDTKKSMSIIAKNFFKNEDKPIELIGVTGTNGKTSTVGFIKQILQYDGKVGSIGTIEIFDGNKAVKSKNTTPESLDIQRSIYDMCNNDCNYCVMEVSSHALVLDRVENIDYKIGVFTNLTQDHLDFHKNIESYKNAKKKLFYKTSYANLFNIDDEVGEEFYKSIENKNAKNYSYAVYKEADFRATNIRLYNNKTKYTLIVNEKEYEVSIPVLGNFNVYNSLAAIATCVLLGLDFEKIINRFKNIKNIEGRMDYVENNRDIDVIVDYAHTPDALLKLIKSARCFTEGRIILVFGCGGNRDKDKRCIMGKIAQENADISIITSDNPRFEKPLDIIDDILKGLDISLKNYIIVENRKDAIKKAIEIYNKGDLILIAGKGHENYQIVNDKKYFFDDKLTAKEFIDKYDKLMDKNE